MVNQHNTRSLRLGVVSATLLGVKYSSSSLDTSYGSKNECPDTEAVTDGKRLLLGTLSGLLTGIRRCLT